MTLMVTTSERAMTIAAVAIADTATAVTAIIGRIDPRGLTMTPSERCRPWARQLWAMAIRTCPTTIIVQCDVTRDAPTILDGTTTQGTLRLEKSWMEALPTPTRASHYISSPQRAILAAPDLVGTPDAVR